MTTPNEYLILKLRGQVYTSYRPDQLCDQAADLLQSQAERIKGLELLVKVKNKPICDYQELIAERDTLRAEIAAIAAAEPVLVVEKEPDYWSGGHFHEGSKPHIKSTKVWCLPIGTQLFTRPMPAQGVEASMIKLPEPLGYLCDWGDDRYGLPNQIVYYDGPGSAIEDDWNEHPEVHLNTPIYTEAQLKQAVRDALDAEDAARAKGVK